MSDKAREQYHRLVALAYADLHRRGFTETVVELFYRDASGGLVAVEVKTSPTLSLGRSTPLFPAAEYLSDQFSPQYDVSLDDRRFLMIRPVAASASDKLIVVDNWFEELKAKSRK